VSRNSKAVSPVSFPDASDAPEGLAVLPPDEVPAKVLKFAFCTIFRTASASAEAALPAETFPAKTPIWTGNGTEEAMYAVSARFSGLQIGLLS